MDFRWIVDAMNVIGSRPNKWWNDPDAAMREFADAVDAYARTHDMDVTIVFDKDPGDLPRTNHIEVVIATRKGRNAADFEIERMVRDDEEPQRLRVVTSDRRLTEQVMAAGAGVVSAGRFRDEIWR